MLGGSSFDVTTALLVVGALFVVYMRLRNWFDTNIPLLYYGLMIVYTNALGWPALALGSLSGYRRSLCCCALSL